MLTSAFRSALKHRNSKAKPATPLYELTAVDVAKHAAIMFLDQREIADVRVATQWRQDGTDSGACFASNALQDNMHVNDNKAMQITEGYLHTCCSLERLDFEPPNIDYKIERYGFTHCLIHRAILPVWIQLLKQCRQEK